MFLGRSVNKNQLIEWLYLVWESPVFMTWASFLARMITFLGVLPLILNRYSVEEVALWYSIVGIIVMGRYIESGFGVTLQRIYSYLKPSSSHALGEVIDKSIAIDTDLKKMPIRAVHGIGQRVYALLALFYLLYFSLVSVLFAAPIATSLGELNKFIIAVSLIGVFQALGLFSRKYEVYLSGSGQLAQCQRVMAFVSIIVITFLFVAMYVGLDFYVLMVISQLNPLFRIIVLRRLIKSRGNSIYKDSIFGEADSKIWEVLWESSWRSGLGGFIGGAVVNFIPMAIAAFVDPRVGASYLVGIRVLSAISEFSNAPFYAHLPTMNNLRANGKIDILIKYAQKGVQRSLLVFNCAILFVTLIGANVLNKIKNEVDFPTGVLWFLMTLAFFTQRYGAMHLQVYTTTNKVVWHWVNLIDAIVAVILIVCLFDSLGIIAFPLSMIIASLISYLPISLKLSLNSLNQSWWAFEKRGVVLPIGVFLLISGLGWVVA